MSRVYGHDPKAQVRCLERRDVRLFLSDEELAEYRHVTLNCSTIDIYRLACVDLLLCFAGQCDDINAKQQRVPTFLSIRLLQVNASVRSLL